MDEKTTQNASNTPPTTKREELLTCQTCNKVYPLKQFSNKRVPKNCIKCAVARDQASLARRSAERKTHNRKVRGKKSTAAANAANAKRRLENMEADEHERAVKAEQKKLLKEEARKRLKKQRGRASAVDKSTEGSIRNALSPEEVMAQRVLIRRSLLEYINYFHGDYDAGWVHRLICKKLEKFLRDVEDRNGPRLMIFMPPRSGKSTIASQYFPSWSLGHHPEWEVIAASYAVSLPLEFSRDNRALIQEPRYHQIFPGTNLDKQNQSADGWKTTRGGGYLPAGVGGGITGKGAHILVIDDPLKDSEEADSEIIRTKAWNWWDSTAKTRLSPGGGVLVFHTRWNDGDLAGLLMKQQADLHKEMDELIKAANKRYDEAYATGDQEEMNEALDSLVKLEEEKSVIENWEVLSFPALAEQDEFILGDGTIVTDGTIPGARELRKAGEALHETRWSRLALLQRKKSMIPRWWNSMYQQNPVPDSGEYFQKDWFRNVDANWLANNWQRMRKYSAWDLAIGEKTQNDFTVGITAGLDYDGNIYILDVIRARMGSKQIAEAILDMHSRWNTQLIGIEEGQIQLAIMPLLRDEMVRRRVYPTFTSGKDALKPINDKRARARVGQGMAQNGRIYLPPEPSHPWVPVLVGEMIRFPAGLFDDQVDAFAWLCRMLSGAKPPQLVVAAKKKSWKDKVRGIAQGQNRKNPMGA